MMPNHLTSAERGAYSRGFDRAARAYLRANGSPSVSAATAGEWTAEDARKLREHSASWHATHDATRASKCHAGGMSAVRKLHRDIVTRAAKYAALEITSADHLATLTAQAETAAARLAELDAAEGKPVRKPRARKLSPVPDLAPVAETVDPATSETVAVVRLRKGSKLTPCADHAARYGSMSRADQLRTAVEGGMSTPCVGSGCVLTPGTDTYTRELVAAGPVRVDVLNGSPAPVVAEVDNSAAAVEARRAMFAGLGWSTTPAADATPAPDAESTAPESVPDPLPPMTRAARKQTRRELAATMRAAGVKPEGAAWRDACAAAGLPVRDAAPAEVNA